MENPTIKMPVEFSYRKDDGGRVAVWRILETENQLATLLPDDSELDAQLKQFNCQTRRLEWLASRVLLYQMTGCVPKVEYTKTGQPFVPESGQNISISHTKGFAAICIAPLNNAGVDIEYPSERISRLAARFIHSQEALYIPHEKEALYHALIWCAKETLFKMAANSGIIFKDDLKVKPFTASSEGIMEATLSLKNEVKTYQLLYKVECDYYLVWHY